MMYCFELKIFIWSSFSQYIKALHLFTQCPYTGALVGKLILTLEERVSIISILPKAQLNYELPKLKLTTKF